MIIKLSGNAEINNRTTLAHTQKLAMQLILIGTGLSHSIIFLASFSKYCESKHQMYIFDEIIEFVEEEELGITKSDILSARTKIEK